MNRRMMKMICLLLCALLIFTAPAGCGKAAQEPAFELFANSYAANHILLPHYEQMYCACVTEDTAVYFASESGASPALYSVSLTDQQTGELTSFTKWQEASQRQGYSSVLPYCIAAGPEGSLRALVSRYSVGNGQDLEKVQIGECSLWLFSLEPDGKVARETLLSLPEPTPLTYEKPRLFCDQEGFTYYQTDSDGITVFDPQCQELGRFSGQIQQLVPLADGRMAGLTSNADGAWDVFLLNPETQTAEPFGSLPMIDAGTAAFRFYPGGEEWDFFCATDLSLYGYRLGRDGQPGAGRQLLSWVNCDMEGSAVLALGGGPESFAGVASSDALGNEAAVFHPAESSSQQTTLVLACRELPSDMARHVLQFNRQNNGFRVEIRDYGATSLNGGLGAGADRLTTDLLSGDPPDLFCTDGLDWQSLVDQDLLEDLWPYIEQDTALGGRDGLVEPVFLAASQQGKLYQVFSGFSIVTAMAKTSLVGDTPGWTPQQFQKIYQGMADCKSIDDCFYSTKSNALERIIRLCAQQFLDRESWTASFDSPAFVSLLEYVNAYPDQPAQWIDGESGLWAQDGQQLMRSIVLTNPMDFSEFPILVFGTEPVTYIGFPGAEGNGSAFRLETPLAIYAKSPNKENAWAFLRTLLLPENQRRPSVWYWDSSIQSMPSNRAALEIMIQDMERIPRDAGTSSLTTPDGQELEFSPWSEADAAGFEDFLNGITIVERTEENIAAIIRDEAARYFAGDQTAEAAAKAIQSRVNLHLGERKK